MSRYTVTVTLGETTILTRSFNTQLAAQVFAADWSDGEFVCVVSADRLSGALLVPADTAGRSPSSSDAFGHCTRSGRTAGK